MFTKPLTKMVVVSILVLLLNACASQSFNLVKSGDVKVITVDSGQVNISNVFVQQLRDEVLIHADVKPVTPVRFFDPGFLNFELIDADKNSIFNLSVIRYSREHQEARPSALKHASFWVRMPMEIPKGSTLKVSHFEHK